MTLAAWSLFAGIGGFDLGLERAGWAMQLHAEQDANRRGLLDARWPDAESSADVREVATGARPGRCGAVGGSVSSADARQRGPGGEDGHAGPALICGGFPCQDVSVAGRRAGLAGERSGLFFEFARIVGTVRPRAVLVENVPGLLSSNGGRDFDAVVGTLADLRYGVAWRVLDSRFFGVPQRRRRVFILALDIGGRAGAECAGQVLAVGSGCGGHPETRAQAQSGGAPGGAGGGAARPLTAGTGQRYDAGTDDLIVSATGFHAQQDPVTEPGGSPPLERGSGGQGVQDAAGMVRRLTPTECERLQGFPDGWTEPLGADSPRYAALGDAVTVPVAEWIGGRLWQTMRST